MRHLLAVVAWGSIVVSMAQDLGEGHRLIDEYHKAERYQEVITLVEAQVDRAVGTAWEDSVFKYVYPYGRALRVVEGPEKAVAGTERLVKFVERRNNPRHLINALFDQSWIYYELGRTRDCIRTDSMAMVVADRNPSVPAAIRGRTRQYLAFDYNFLGDYRTMARYAQEALDVYDRADEVDPVQFSESYNALGAALWHLGRIREAETNYKKALDALGADSSMTAMMRRAFTSGNLGIIWSDAGDLARSKSYYRENLKILDMVISTGDDPSMKDEAVLARSRTYVNLATLSYLSGDMGRSRVLLQMAKDDRSQVLGSDDQRVLSLYEQMADVEIAANELEKAEGLLTTAMEATERGTGKQSEAYARICIRRAEIALRKNDHERAAALYDEVIRIRRPMDEGTDFIMMQALRGRARVNSAFGRNREVIADLMRAREIVVRMNGPVHYRVAELEILLAEESFQAGEYKQAQDHAKAVLGMVQDRVDALQRSRVTPQFPAPDLLPDAIYWKVSAERAMRPEERGSGRWNEELDLAVRALTRTHYAIEDEASKLLFFGAHDRLFDLALEDAFDSYAQKESEKGLQRFFNLSETNRNVLLKERLSGFAGVSFAGVPDSILAQEQELRKSLIIDTDNPQAQIGMDQREQEYTDFLRRLEKEYPKYFELRYADRAPLLDEVRARLLNADRQMLIFVRTPERLFAAIIGTRGSKLIELDADGLDGRVKALNKALAERDDPTYKAQAQAIHHMVFEPLEPHLYGRELLIIPDGELHTVNFELLMPANVQGDYRKQLLIQRYTIGYLFSATTSLQFVDLTPMRAKGIFAMAPGFTDQLKQEYLAQVLDSLLVDHRFLQYVRQPFAMRTAQALGRSYKAKVLTGQAASEASFRQCASDYGILFLGTHADMDPTHPMYSRLVFSKDGDGSNPEQDGYLHVYEIYELDLRAQLAVLTACESGGGQEVAGEGIRSLGAAFAYAGCPSLVVALWNIDEKVSAAIIETFYKNLAAGLPKHEALRKAKLQHLDNAVDELANPYYWAGLVLLGNVEPVRMDPAGPPRWMWAAGVVLVLGGIVWRGTRRRRARQAGPASA